MSWQMQLNDNEDLVIDQIPHWSLFIFSLAQVLLIIIVSVVAINMLSGLPVWTLVFPIAVLLLGFLKVLSRLAKYRFTHLIVTTERLIDVQGVFRRRIREIPIRQISNLTSSQRLLERLYRCGSLRVEYSGEIGHDDFAYVRRPDRIVRFLSGRISSGFQQSSDLPRRSPLDELVKLEELRNRGTLSEQEYDRAKSRLLDQL